MFKNEFSEQYGQQYFLEEENYSPPCRRTYKIQRESIKILFFIDFTMGRRTSAKINRPTIQPSPGIQGIQTGHGKQSGRQVSLLGAKSRHVGDKCEIMRPEHSEHPELTGRQVGDKCEIMRPEHLCLLGDKWETNGRQMADKCEIMRPEH